jgi:small subunit ribosomal protein S17
MQKTSGTAIDPKSSPANKSAAKVRSFSGIVASAKMDKTVVVVVEHVFKHPRYGKRTIVSERFKAHDERNFYKEGDKVLITECRPMSKEKKWRVVYEKNTN